MCIAPDVKAMQAAKVIRKDPRPGNSTAVWLDLGPQDLISKKWYAALIDENGHLVTDWVRLEGLTRYESVVVFPIRGHLIDEETARVALVEELPQ